MASYGYITNAGIARAISAYNGGVSSTQINITSAHISTNSYYNANAATMKANIQSVTVLPNVVFTAGSGAIYYNVLDSSDILFKILLSNTVGPFTYSSFSLNLDDGTAFAVVTYDAVQTKSVSTLGIGGDTVYLEVLVQYTNLAGTVNVSVLTADNGSLPELDNETLLPAPYASPYPVYFLHHWNAYQDGRSALASRFQGVWNFYPCYEPGKIAAVSAH